MGDTAMTNNPDVEQLVLSNAVCYDSWPVPDITEIGLPNTLRETSIKEVQEIVEKVLGDRFYGDIGESFLDGITTPWGSEEGVTSLVRNAIATNTNHTTEIDPAALTAETLLL